MKVPWQPQIACFSSVTQNNVFVVKICKYAPYEGIILRSPKASQPLPGWRGMEEVHWTWSNLWATLNQNHRHCDRCHKTVVIHPNADTDDTGDIEHYILKMSMLAVWQQFCGNSHIVSGFVGFHIYVYDEGNAIMMWMKEPPGQVPGAPCGMDFQWGRGLQGWGKICQQPDTTRPCQMFSNQCL